jgi:hypothetical protein
VKKSVRLRVGAMSGDSLSAFRIDMAPAMQPQTSWT